MKKRFTYLFVLIFTLSLVVFSFHRNTSASFYANNLMDDGVFNNSGTMGAAQIDAFLNSFPSSCISTSRGFTAPDVTGYNPSQGYLYGANVSAGTIISHASQAYDLNPQVILATLQKEQGLVSGGAGCHYETPPTYNGNCPEAPYGTYTSCVTACQYSGGCVYIAMGYDCPHYCVPNSTGFSAQIIKATWKLKFVQQRSLGNYNWNIQKPGWDNSDDPQTDYGGYMTQGVFKRNASSSPVSYDGYRPVNSNSATVHLDTGATASLYSYTPFTSGNQSFVDKFEMWFGPTRGEGFSLVTSQLANGDTRQWVIYHGSRHLIPNTDVKVAWGLDNVTLLQWDDEYLGSFPDGPPLSRLMRPSGSQDVYFVDAAKAYKLPSAELMNSWGFNPAAIVDVSVYLSQLPTNSGFLTSAVRSTSNATNIYLVDGGAKRRYADPNILAAWEGDSSSNTTLSDTYFNAMGTGTDISSTKITDGSQKYLVTLFTKLPLTSITDTFYPGTAISVSTATLNRLGTASAANQFVKSPTQPTVYLVDNLKKYAVGNTDYLKAWAFGSNPVVNTVAQGNLNLLTDGGSLNTFEADISGQLYIMDGRKISVPSGLDSAYRTTGNVFSASVALLSLFQSGPNATNFIKGSGASVFFMDAGQRRHVGSPNALSLLGNGESFVTVSDYVLSQFGTTAGGVGAYISADGVNNYIVEGGSKHLVSGSVKSNWGLGAATTVNASTLARYPTGSALGNKAQNQGQYFLVHQGAAYGTADGNIASIWGINDAPSMNPAILREFLGSQMLTRVASSKTPGDSRLFIVDRGMLYRLYPNQALNLGVQGPFTAVDPSAFTVNDWTKVVVKDEAGVNYAIDGGRKRLLPAGVIRDQWTYGNYAAVPTMTNGFLNMLPNSIQMERTIKGSGPTVYTVENFAKRWVQNPSTYSSSYAPFTPVSDTLVELLSNGSSVQ